VLQDYAKAVYWYTKAVEQGDEEVQNCLGDCCKYERGVPQD